MNRGGPTERDAAQLVTTDVVGERERGKREEVRPVDGDVRTVREHLGEQACRVGTELHGREHETGRRDATEEAAARQRRVDACTKASGERETETDHR